jgi:hypothetical protein
MQFNTQRTGLTTRLRRLMFITLLFMIIVLGVRLPIVALTTPAMCGGCTISACWDWISAVMCIQRSPVGPGTWRCGAILTAPRT